MPFAVENIEAVKGDLCSEEVVDVRLQKHKM